MEAREILLILHFFGLALGLGVGMAMLSLNMFVAKKLAPEERASFMAKTRPLMFIAPLGLLILIISGIFLIIPIWAGIKTNMLIHIKLTVALLMLIFVGLLHMLAAKSRRTGKPSKAMGLISKVQVLLGITAIILAVLIFH